jgi:hypothetical protein
MSESHPAGPGGQQPRANWILIGFIAIAAFFLITEHTAHVLGALPYVILLACPLLHFFMHRGHGGHDHHHGRREEDSK